MRFLPALLLLGCVASRVPAWVAPAADEAERVRLIADGAAALRAGDAARALTLAERALAAHRALRERACAGRPPEEVFAVAEPRDLDALCLYVEASFAWSDERGIPTLMARQDSIRAAALRAAALDRTCAHGAPDRVLALLDTTLPLEKGANLMDGFERFQAAIANAPGYLANQVALAERFYARMGERDAFRETLARVLAADPAALPDALAENRLAQARARWLLGR